MKTVILRPAWNRCRSNLKANICTGIFISLAIGLVCIGYYRFDRLGNILDHLGNLKSSYGFFYSAVSTAFFGGIIPYTVLAFRNNVPHKKRRSWFLFFVVFWAIKGIEVDGFYRLQNYFYGESQDFRIILYKVLTDMFVYCVFWSAPTTAIFYGWKKAGFVWKGLRELCSPEVLISESAFLLFTTWIIWIPAVSIIYSMPSNLQIPCFNLTLCFFVIVVSFIEPTKSDP